MLSESNSALAGAGSRADFLRATLGSAAALAAVVAKPKESPAFGKRGMCVVCLVAALAAGGVAMQGNASRRKEHDGLFADGHTHHM